jgi:hypothetical protein
MQAAITWWCNIIGVTDPTSIQIASGVVSGGAALFVAYVALLTVMAIFSLIWAAVRDYSS